MLRACRHNPFTTPDVVFTVDSHVGCSPMLVVSTTRRDSSSGDAPRFISIEGDLDVYSVQYLTSVLVGMNGGATAIVVDTSGVAFIDTHGLAALEELRDLSAERGGRVWLHEPCRAVRRILDLVGGAQQFDICSAGASRCCAKESTS